MKSKGKSNLKYADWVFSEWAGVFCCRAEKYRRSITRSISQGSVRCVTTELESDYGNRKPDRTAYRCAIQPLTACTTPPNYPLTAAEVQLYTRACARASTSSTNNSHISLSTHKLRTLYIREQTIQRTTWKGGICLPRSNP